MNQEGDSNEASGQGSDKNDAKVITVAKLNLFEQDDTCTVSFSGLEHLSAKQQKLRGKEAAGDIIRVDDNTQSQSAEESKANALLISPRVEELADDSSNEDE